jgi:hypothetical protein
VSFADLSLCVASQRVFIVVSVYFVIDSVRKFLDSCKLIPIIVTLVSAMRVLLSWTASQPSVTSYSLKL